MPSIRLTDKTKRDLDAYADELRERGSRAATHSDVVTALLSAAACHTDETGAFPEAPESVTRMRTRLIEAVDEAVALFAGQIHSYEESAHDAETLIAEQDARLERLTRERDALAYRTAELERATSKVDEAKRDAARVKEENATLRESARKLEDKLRQLGTELESSREEARKERHRADVLEEENEALATRMKRIAMGRDFRPDCESEGAHGTEGLSQRDGAFDPREPKGLKRQPSLREVIQESRFAAEVLSPRRRKP